MFSRKCPDCENDIHYKNKGNFKRAIKKNTKCNLCCVKKIGFEKGHNLSNGKIPWNKGKQGSQVAWNKGLTKDTDDRVKKYSDARSGKPLTFVIWNKGLTAQTDDRVAKNVNATAKTLSRLHAEGKLKSPSVRPDVRQKMRETMTAKFDEFGVFPSFNRNACIIFDDINNELGWNGVYATNGGEFKVIGYYLDYYEPSKNIVIEYYENFHKKKSRTVRDLFRQESIISELKCKFYIIKEWEPITWREILKSEF